MSKQEEIQQLEKQIFELKQQLAGLHRDNPSSEVPNYEFSVQGGKTSLSELFETKDKLLLIHNMGQGCRYCTLWADGFNGFLPHLEDALSVVLVSKDAPDLQRQFANSRGWRFRLASHGGGDYIKEQTAMDGAENYPGAVLYEKRDGRVYRKNSAVFGPGDNFCSAWDLLSLAGLDASTWTPQYQYWKRPQKMDDGGENIN